MKAGFLVLGLLLAGHCYAAVKFVGANWQYGGREHKVIKKAGQCDRIVSRNKLESQSLPLKCAD